MERVAVLSNDTDVVVRLHFNFFFLGLKECWIRVGTGEKTRFIPIHMLERKLGYRTYCAVLKAHILTGCDVTSKIGKKTAAIKASVESYLHNFGEENNSSAAKSFDELRYLWYDMLMTSCRCHKSVMLMLKFSLEKFRGPKIPQNQRKKPEINKKTEKLNTFAICITDKLQNV